MIKLFSKKFKFSKNNNIMSIDDIIKQDIDNK